MRPRWTSTLVLARLNAAIAGGGAALKAFNRLCPLLPERRRFFGVPIPARSLRS
jgi:hypothetical protein